jgi:hypothetical protein
MNVRISRPCLPHVGHRDNKNIGGIEKFLSKKICAINMLQHLQASANIIVTISIPHKEVGVDAMNISRTIWGTQIKRGTVWNPSIPIKVRAPRRTDIDQTLGVRSQGLHQLPNGVKIKAILAAVPIF